MMMSFLFDQKRMRSLLPVNEDLDLSDMDCVLRSKPSQDLFAPGDSNLCVFISSSCFM